MKPTEIDYYTELVKFDAKSNLSYELSSLINPITANINRFLLKPQYASFE